MKDSWTGYRIMSVAWRNLTGTRKPQRSCGFALATFRIETLLVIVFVFVNAAADAILAAIQKWFDIDRKMEFSVYQHYLICTATPKR